VDRAWKNSMAWERVTDMGYLSVETRKSPPKRAAFG
jgi:hypothetical protein